MTLVVKLFRDDAVKTFTDMDNVHDAHIAKICFGGDVPLKPRAQWLAKEITKDSKRYCKGNQQETPKVGPSLLHWHKGKGRREKRGGSHIGAAAGVDGEFSFAGANAFHGFIGCNLDVVFVEAAHQVKAGRVGMSPHGLIFKFTG